jgi:hypothetical protein
MPSEELRSVGVTTAVVKVETRSVVVNSSASVVSRRLARARARALVAAWLRGVAHGCRRVAVHTQFTGNSQATPANGTNSSAWLSQKSGGNPHPPPIGGGGSPADCDKGALRSTVARAGVQARGGARADGVEASSVRRRRSSSSSPHRRPQSRHHLFRPLEAGRPSTIRPELELGASPRRTTAHELEPSAPAPMLTIPARTPARLEGPQVADPHPYALIAAGGLGPIAPSPPAPFPRPPA